MKMKTEQLKDEALDWAVATALGLSPRLYKAGPVNKPKWISLVGNDACAYSRDWRQGGPTIDSEHIELLYYGTEGRNGNPWEAQIGQDTHYIDQYPGDAIGGPTALIAAMRGYVTSKLGAEVEVPNELLRCADQQCGTYRTMAGGCPVCDAPCL